MRIRMQFVAIELYNRIEYNVHLIGIMPILTAPNANVNA